MVKIGLKDEVINDSKIVLGIILAQALFCFSGCLLPYLPESHGSLELQLPNGKKVYVKERTWGRGDVEFALSPNKNGDPFIDSRYDWKFLTYEGRCYYKINSNDEVCIGGPPAENILPPKEPFPVKVKFITFDHVLDDMEFQKTLKQQGFKEVVIHLSDV